jgi:hypothetical protein
MRLWLSTTEMLFETDKSSVTHLAVTPGVGLTLNDPYGHTAGSGPLVLGLDLALTETSTTATGSVALKSVSGTSFTAGPIVEGLIAGAGVTLSSTIPTVELDSSILHQGNVTVSLSTLAANRELPPWSTRLAGVQERLAGIATFLGMPATYPSSVIYEFRIPAAGLPATSPVAKLVFFARGAGAGTLPNIGVSYLEVANPGTGVGNLSATPAATNLTTISGGTITAVGDFYQKSTDTFTITPGAAVFVSLTRAGSDGYSYELDLFQPTLVISGS